MRARIVSAVVVVLAVAWGACTGDPVLRAPADAAAPDASDVSDASDASDIDTGIELDAGDAAKEPLPAECASGIDLLADDFERSTLTSASDPWKLTGTATGTASYLSIDSSTAVSGTRSLSAFASAKAAGTDDSYLRLKNALPLSTKDGGLCVIMRSRLAAEPVGFANGGYVDILQLTLRPTTPSADAAASDPYFSIGAGTGGVKLSVTGAGSAPSAGFSPPSDDWRQWVLRIDRAASTVSLSVDGVVKVGPVNLTLPAISSAELGIGLTSSGTTPAVTSHVDDLRVVAW